MASFPKEHSTLYFDEMLCFENNIFVIHKKGIVAIKRVKDDSVVKINENVTT